MLHQYQTIIWDWNGTLLNDIALCVNIANDMLSGHQDRQLSEGDYKDAFGFPITAYYERIGIDLQRESFEKLTERFIANYSAGVKNCALHASVPEVLQVLSDRQTSQFILTAAHRESVIPLLDHFEIHHHFTYVEGLDNHRAESKVMRGKQLIDKQGIHPQQALLIGDTIHDYEVAREIGVDCLLIANGHQSKSRLVEKTAGQIPVLDQMADLLS